MSIEIYLVYLKEIKGRNLTNLSIKIHLCHLLLGMTLSNLFYFFIYSTNIN